jgi:hypothetical protein
MHSTTTKNIHDPIRCGTEEHRLNSWASASSSIPQNNIFNSTVTSMEYTSMNNFRTRLFICRFTRLLAARCSSRREGIPKGRYVVLDAQTTDFVISYLSFVFEQNTGYHL